MQSFYEYNLSDNLNKSLKTLGFKNPTEIQSKTIPIALKRHDILASAETGSGKTAAYLIPLIHHISTIGGISGLILTPTRELAQQVTDVSKSLVGYKSKIETALIVGGASMNNQLRQLKKRPKIIVGTPGRINDHLEKKTLNLKYFNFFVLDEADRMLDMGFEDQVEKIIRFLPSKRQTLLFSATLPKEIIKLSSKYLNNPKRADVKENNVIKTQIKQKILNTKTELKYNQLVDEIAIRKGSILIFVRTKYSTEKLKKRLMKDTVKSSALHGDLRQNKRSRILKDFRDDKFRILIATDIASRGLDVPHIEHVINYDLPQVPEDFIHRIGRTARAGSVGEAVSFITPNDKRMWKSIENLMEELKNPEHVPENKKVNQKEFKKRNRNRKRNSKSRKYYQKSRN
ncbi:MAG: DEAD/DEAH box helicase [SAR202 cluster bacterium]|jgi:ATP-dependent RNA helicase DeaD|nr:MAG: DEAD/DEAH box helicase [SAR202 cluster bacterium]KAA1298866.1 MAG: DEAD/DEAH box helicase [SAR202 cluster bacterium]|tara:strand:+ start:21718 stop:22920 length:1203 start_codon:yes stop_codon:yes gene_type:complete